MNARRFQSDRLAAQLRDCDEAIEECGGRVDVATDDVKVQVLSDLADALRERHERIQRKIASVRSAMGLPETARDDERLASDWASLHSRQRLAAGL